MSGDPIVALLAKQSAAKLREMRGAADAQIRDLQSQVAWIDRALAEKGYGEPNGTSEGDAPRPGRRRGSKRNIIRTVLATDASREWSPREIQAALAERGIDSTIESVRVTLRRMINDNEVGRGEHGYKSVSANGSAQGSLDGAPSLGAEDG